MDTLLLLLCAGSWAAVGASLVMMYERRRREQAWGWLAYLAVAFAVIGVFLIWLLGTITG